MNDRDRDHYQDLVSLAHKIMYTEQVDEAIEHIFRVYNMGKVRALKDLDALRHCATKAGESTEDSE